MSVAEKYAALTDETSVYYTGSTPNPDKEPFFARKVVPIIGRTDAHDAFGKLHDCSQFAIVVPALKSAGICTLSDLVGWKDEGEELAGIVASELEDKWTDLRSGGKAVLQRSVRNLLAAACELPSTPEETTAPVEPVVPACLVPDGNNDDDDDEEDDGIAGNVMADALQTVNNDDYFKAVNADNKLFPVLASPQFQAAFLDGFSEADVSAIENANIDQYNEYQHDVTW